MFLRLGYFYVILIFCLLQFNQIFCINSSLLSIEIDENAKIIAKVLHDIVDEFFTKQCMSFDTIIFRYLPKSTVEIYNEFLATRNERFSRTLHTHGKLHAFQKYTVMWSSAILFLRSLDDIINIEYFYKQLRKGNQAIKYFIFIPNLTYLQLKFSTILSEFEQLDIRMEFMFLYTFFITDEKETVILSTIEWFEAANCQKAQLKKLNEYDKKSGKWIKKLENYEKFLEYNGCELVLMVSAPVDGVVNDVSNYAIINEHFTNFELKGIVPKVFEIAAKAHNFFPFYQPAVILQMFLHTLNPNFLQVYFRSISSFNYFERLDAIKTSHAFVDTSFRISVTPGELYTPYEKLFLPFDLETWIMLVVTFLTTFLSILMINRLSKSTQSIVYGHRVYTPFWNVVSIFFGISLTRLPSKNFSRFILILFVFFCLIFRTCFQSKFFEFMTSEPRRLPPKTMEDLIENGFTLYLMKENYVEELFHSYERRPNFKSIEINEFYNLFKSQSKNSSAKLALLVDELWQNHIENSTRKTYDWNQLEETFFVSHDYFAFHACAFHFRMFRKLINRLIDTGVMKYLSDNYYTKAPKLDPIYSEPKVLSLDDMMFGFNIWFGFCGISLAGFVAEVIFYSLFTKKHRKVKFAKIHPQFQDRNHYACKLKTETIKKFRIKMKNPVNNHHGVVQINVKAEIHNYSNAKEANESENRRSKINCKSKRVSRHWQNYDEIEEIIDTQEHFDTEI